MLDAGRSRTETSEASAQTDVAIWAIGLIVFMSPCVKRKRGCTAMGAT